VSEHEFEPVRGLPEVLPAGERMLWQGAPRWQSLAVQAFHVRKVAVYFALLAAFQAAAALVDGEAPAAAIAASSWLVALGVIAVSTLALLAWLAARGTVYTLTDRRIVMRFGIALPMTVNLPFSVVESAAAGRRSDGTADIALTLARGSRIGYLVNWPNVRPWHFSRPQPMLRALPDGERAAALLADALAAQTKPAAAASTQGTSPAGPTPLTAAA
jgi:hypothetical protein